MSLLGIYGASGFGREVMGMIQNKASHSYEEIVFIDDSTAEVKVNNHRCLTWDGFLREPNSTKEVVLAIADSRVRETLSDRCRRAGFGFYQAHAENSIILDEVQIGDGSIICPFSMITSNVEIGLQFHCNIYSYVAHDCTIGNYVTFAPGVKCNGNVLIEDHAYVGTGAILRQGKPGNPLVIGEGAVVGMGAVVTKNVPAGATVVGNPARLLERD